MIDEKKLIEEIKKRRDYWESKAAEYDEAGERYEYLMDVCNGKATELTATLSIINEQPKVAEWIPCSERLPENAKHKGAFCPKPVSYTHLFVFSNSYHCSLPSFPPYFIICGRAGQERRTK